MTAPATPPRQAGRTPPAKPDPLRTKVKVTLGGRDFELSPLTLGPARRWRKELSGPFTQLTELLQGAQVLDIQNVQNLMTIIRLAGDVLVDAPDIVYGLLIKYAPDVFDTETCEWLDANAFDTEIVPAFLACLRQVYPLEQMMDSLGPSKRPTS